MIKGPCISHIRSYYPHLTAVIGKSGISYQCYVQQQTRFPICLGLIRYKTRNPRFTNLHTGVFCSAYKFTCAKLVLCDDQTNCDNQV